ncbi:MAG: CoA transferase, partial [Planctomycetota bacterium]
GAKIFQEPRLLDDKYNHVRDRARHRAAVDSMITPWTKSHRKKEVFQAGHDHDFAFGYLASFEEVMESPQHKAREFFEEIDHPVVGKHKYCQAPFKMSRTPWQSDRAPLLGEHNKLIYGNKLEYSVQKIERLGEEGVI